MATKTKKTSKKVEVVAPVGTKEKLLNTLSLFKSKKEYVVFGLCLLGVLSLLAGVGLIIAAHWAVIPAFVRVMGALSALGIALGVTAHLKLTGWTKCSEVALFVSYLLIGGNIALVQQTYNLAISWRDGCLLWSLLGLPLAFLAQFSLVRWCTIVLFGFGIWAYIPEWNYLMISGILFLFFMGSLPLADAYWDHVRKVLFFIMWTILFLGDFVQGREVAVGLDLLCFLLMTTWLSSQKRLLLYNSLFVYAGLRIVMLFWHAHSLHDMGIRLIACGTVLLTLGGLYYKFFEKLQVVLRRWTGHE